MHAARSGILFCQFVENSDQIICDVSSVGVCRVDVYPCGCVHAFLFAFKTSGGRTSCRLVLEIGSPGRPIPLKAITVTTENSIHLQAKATATMALYNAFGMGTRCSTGSSVSHLSMFFHER